MNTLYNVARYNAIKLQAKHYTHKDVLAFLEFYQWTYLLLHK